MSDRHLAWRTSPTGSLLGWLFGLTLTTAALPPFAMKIIHWTPSAIVSDQYESSPTFTPDGRELFFMRSNRSFTAFQILRSSCGPDGWGRPEPVPFGLPPPVNDADPFVTADGKRLYFVSSRAFAGKIGDDLDIWVVERTATGAWSEPVRLPEPVNSAHTELMPRAKADGRIFFGSDRPGGVGGTDIYVATPQHNGQWRVDNLGADVNRPGNDYEAEVSLDGRTMIVVSDRGDRSHLYRFVKDGQRWRQVDQIPARADVFQVGPLLSPKADRLLFAQVDGDRSGKMFLADLVPNPDLSWPPQGRADRSSR